MAKTKGFITTPFEVSDKLLRLGRVGVDAILIYHFVQYTSLWQNKKFGINNRPKATNDYILKALHLRKQYFLESKKILIEMGLVIPRKVIDPLTKRVSGHYLEMPFINNNPEVPDGTHGVEKARGSQNHPMEMGTTNTDSTNYLNTDGYPKPQRGLVKEPSLNSTLLTEVTKENTPQISAYSETEETTKPLHPGTPPIEFLEWDPNTINLELVRKEVA